MRGFDSNKCRVCSNVFCCEKCREKHEKLQHHVFSGCDICVYGQIRFSSLTEPLLQEHLRTAHLPLRCVFCNQINRTVDDLLQHKECPVLVQDSPKTPYRQQVPPNILISLDDQDSPILQEFKDKEVLDRLMQRATSTPMHRMEEGQKTFEKSSNVLTPVVLSSSSVGKSIMKKDGSKKNESSSKRIVTFGETFELKELKSIGKEEHAEEVAKPDSSTFETFYTPTTTSNMNASQFFSAKTDVSKTPSTSGPRKTKEDILPEGSTPVGSTFSLQKQVMPENNFTKKLEEAEEESPTSKEGSDLNRVSTCTPISEISSTQQSQHEESKELAVVSPQASSKRRVSIVLPTPIMKRTDIRMKLQLPAHFASTPIMSSGLVKMRHTKIIEEISTRVIRKNTPYKAPPSYDYAARRSVLMRSEFAGPSTYPEEEEEEEKDKDVEKEKDDDDDNDVSFEDARTQQSDFFEPSMASVSSMTESSLWSSMSRIVKSVLGGFGNNKSADDAAASFLRRKGSFKRQLSDPDLTKDFPEENRFKRFKYTTQFANIKCRPPIRDTYALDVPRREMATGKSTLQMATLEIAKSVHTVSEQRFRHQCDKATQTDNYLLIGWNPDV